MKTALAALLICWAAARAESAVAGRSLDLVSFPSSRDFFYPLVADPTELGYSGRYLFRVGGRRFGEVTIGDYVGILRWSLGPGWEMQWNLGGGVEARFDMNTDRNALQVADFTAAAPLDIHHDAHTIRAGYWHTSSHLGDDFIAKTGTVAQKRSLDLMKAVYSYAPGGWFRLYGGGSYAFNAVHISGRDVLQAGAELTTPYFFGDHRAQWFLAQDLQGFERARWNPGYTLRGGLRLADSKRIAAAKMFVEYFTGHYYFLQLFEQRESRWGLGLSFEIGNPTK